MGHSMTVIDEEVADLIEWSELPHLPDTSGRAGMFAGISGGRFFCMGGTSFPDRYPWEGGHKLWYDDVFMLENPDAKWQRLGRLLPRELAYGVSVSYQSRMIIVGGAHADGHSDRTWLLTLKGGALKVEEGPPLPHPLANMGGTLVGSLLIVAGGMASPKSPPLHCCYGLDLDALTDGWFALREWPGEGRILPVTGSFAGKFYLFSGENRKQNAVGIEQRHILQDGYCLVPQKISNRWEGQWHRLADLPVGMSAGANPAPLVGGKAFLFWGGVDRLTALHSLPQTHPGISGRLMWYNPETDCWKVSKGRDDRPGRVTLPTVNWNDRAYYVSGEIKPGIRTHRITGITIREAESK